MRRSFSTLPRNTLAILLAVTLMLLVASGAGAQRTVKPVLHGKHWVAITGKPLGATAGAMMFAKGGNAIDAACAMLGATATMWDVLSWGGETQALVYNPNTGEVIGINAVGVAPTGATSEFFREMEMKYPPQFGPLAAVTPGTPGGLMVMLAEYGRLSLADVLAPSIEMADGYPIEAGAANSIERTKDQLKQWKYSRDVFLPHLGEEREAPVAGEIFVQADLAATLRKLVETEAEALAAGKSREEAIYAAYERFYRGDIAEEYVRGSREEGGLHTLEDLAGWEVKLEKPEHANYKGIDVYKLTSWTQGPALLQALNILENADLKSMGYNSARYIHALYQSMNLAFADRDFYYGDPYFPPEEPLAGLLSKEYAKHRFDGIDWEGNNATARPGDPYAFMDGENPFAELLEQWERWDDDNSGADRPDTWNQAAVTAGSLSPSELAAAIAADRRRVEEQFFTGTTSIQAADEDGWVVSVTPSGGWIPAVIAGRTGIGMSQRMQSFVVDERENPYNIVEPGKRPRVTLTPSLALKGGKPFIAFSVQGGDTQDQNLLQFFLNVVEFGMNVQQAVEAANVNSYQMYSSFGDHAKRAGGLTVQDATPSWVLAELRRMGYSVDTRPLTSGPITAIIFDREHGTMWGGASHHGEDYGIAW